MTLIPGAFNSRLRIDGQLIDKAYKKYDIPHMTKGEAENDLTEKEIKFCREYLRIYNVTQSAINAGQRKETAHLWGSAAIRRLRCIKYICWLKYRCEQESHFDAVNMINKLVGMINADATDYAEFGTRTKIVRDKSGNPVEVNGKILKEKVSYLRLKDDSLVDGSLIQEIGYNKGGPYIKFFDKLKAMELLGQFSPMTHQAKMQQERLNLEKERVALQKAQFLYTIQREQQRAGDEKSVEKLKLRMEQRAKQRELAKNGDKRLSEREQLNQEGTRANE